MTTTNDIIASALRKIGQIDGDEPVKPAQFNTAVSALNRMCMRWEAKTISIGWNPIALPADEIGCAIEDEDAVIYNLAVILGAEYDVDVSPTVVALAQSTLNELKNNVFNAESMEMANDAPASQGSRRWNMYVDAPTRGPRY